MLERNVIGRFQDRSHGKLEVSTDNGGFTSEKAVGTISQVPKPEWMEEEEWVWLRGCGFD